MNYTGPRTIDIANTNLLGIGMMYGFQELLFLNHIIRLNDIQHIVEFGTGNGGLTILLGIWKSRLPERSVLSIDNKYYCSAIDTTYEMIKKLGVIAIDGDEGAQDTLNYIHKFIEGKERILYICDGGCKFKNLLMSAELLGPDDVVICHDCCETVEEYMSHIQTCKLGPLLSEMGFVSPKQLARAVEMYKLEELAIEERIYLSESIGNIAFRAFKRIKNANG